MATEIPSLVPLAPGTESRNIRLKQAAELMATKGLSVSEVSFAVGYANVNNFSVAFKELYDVSPTGYSEQYVVTEKLT